MKVTTVIISIATLFTTLSMAAPLDSRATDTATIVLQTGDGDTTIQLSVALDKVVSTADKAFASRGVAAEVLQAGPVCQAFSDNAATKLLGSPFSSATTAHFTTVSTGGVGSLASQALPIGAFLCSASAPGLEKDIAKLTKAVQAAPHPVAAIARLEVEIEADTFIQDEVKADGKIFLTANTRFGTHAIRASVNSATGADARKVSCQAFSDVAAKSPLGKPFGETVFTTNSNKPATLQAFICKVGA